MNDQDRLEREALMALAPKDGQERVAEDRHVTVAALEVEHADARARRAALAAESEWLD